MRPPEDVSGELGSPRHTRPTARAIQREEFALAVGAALRRVRRRRGLTQAGLASLAGVSRNHISDVELGLTRASMLVVYQLTQALQIPWTAIAKAIDHELGRPPIDTPEHPYPAPSQQDQPAPSWPARTRR